MNKIPPRALFAFCFTFMICYPPIVNLGLSMFRYYPSLHRFAWRAIPGGHNAIQWYGWMATAAVVGLVVAAIAWVIPVKSSGPGPWATVAWVVPICMLLASIYVVYLNWWPL